MARNCLLAALPLVAAGCVDADDANSVGVDGDDAGGSATGADPDDDEPAPLPSPPRREPFGAGTRLAPIVWTTPGGLRDQAAIPTSQAAPSTQDIRDKLEPWFDHRLELACAFGLGVEDRCLPRRAYYVDEFGDEALGEFADPDCSQRVVRSDPSRRSLYARRVDVDTEDVLGVSHLDRHENGPIYVRGAGVCYITSVAEYQRILDDVPLEAFVHADVEVEHDRPGRIVPMTLRTEDGAWQYVDAWDTALGQRVDPNDDGGVPLRWLPSTAAPDDVIDSWDRPPGLGTDAVLARDRGYTDPNCEGRPVLEDANERGAWLLQREGGRVLDRVARVGPSAQGSPIYRRATDGTCNLTTPSCPNCAEVLDDVPLLDFPVVEGTMTVGAPPDATQGEGWHQLGRYDWTTSAGDVLHLSDPDRWWDFTLNSPCRRSFSSFDPGGNYYCFPFPSTFPAYEDPECLDRIGQLLEGVTGTPPGYIGTTTNVSQLRQVSWVAVDPGTRVYRADCTLGCTCVPHEVRGPEAFVYDGIGEELAPQSRLLRFDREILPALAR